MRRTLACGALILVLVACDHSPKPPPISNNPSTPHILLFTRARGFHHTSIPTAIDALTRLGIEHGFAVTATSDPSIFTADGLAGYRAVVFLLTTGDVLDEAQQAAFERYIARGGGYVGVHSAADTEYGWAWYGRLVGAFFANHPKIQRATVNVVDRSLASTADLPSRWVRTDEWYNFRTDPSSSVHVLLTVDETTYTGGAMGAHHPIAWCHQVGGGRAWYTAMGHSASAYSEPLFLAHLLRGIVYATSLDPTPRG